MWFTVVYSNNKVNSNFDTLADARKEISDHFTQYPHASVFEASIYQLSNGKLKEVATYSTEDYFVRMIAENYIEEYNTGKRSINKAVTPSVHDLTDDSISFLDENWTPLEDDEFELFSKIIQCSISVFVKAA